MEQFFDELILITKFSEEFDAAKLYWNSRGHLRWDGKQSFGGKLNLTRSKIYYENLYYNFEKKILF